MKKPPESAFEKGSDHHWVVTFANVAFVITWLRFVNLCIRNDVFIGLRKLHSGLVNSFLEDALPIHLIVHLILFGKYIAPSYNQFLLKGITIFPYFQSLGQQLVLCKLNAHTFGNF